MVWPESDDVASRLVEASVAPVVSEPEAQIFLFGGARRPSASRPPSRPRPTSRTVRRADACRRDPTLCSDEHGSAAAIGITRAAPRPSHVIHECQSPLLARACAERPLEASRARVPPWRLFPGLEL